MSGMDAAERAKQYVLVLESNVDDRFMVSMLLQRFGCTICSAHSAEEALEFLTVAPPAAVVSEGGQTGTGLLARIRKDGRFTDIPVILLTSLTDHAFEDRMRQGSVLSGHSGLHREDPAEEHQDRNVPACEHYERLGERSRIRDRAVGARDVLPDP